LLLCHFARAISDFSLPALWQLSLLADDVVLQELKGHLLAKESATSLVIAQRHRRSRYQKMLTQNCTLTMEKRMGKMTFSMAALKITY
jgi:hypothetical protein